MFLFDTQRSGNAWKVRLLAGLLDIQLKRTTLSIDRGDLRDPEFLKRSPFGMVPLLELTDGATISESAAILRYLAEGTSWWPDTALAQARVLSWLSFEQSQHMHPLAQLRLHLALHRDRTADSEDMVRYRADASSALGLLERHLASTRMASMGGIPLAHYPSIVAWLTRMECLPGYQPLFPGRFDLNLSTAEI